MQNSIASTVIQGVRWSADYDSDDDGEETVMLYSPSLQLRIVRDATGDWTMPRWIPADLRAYAQSAIPVSADDGEGWTDLTIREHLEG